MGSGSRQWAVVSGQWAVDSGPLALGTGQWPVHRGQSPNAQWTVGSGCGEKKERLKRGARGWVRVCDGPLPTRVNLYQ